MDAVGGARAPVEDHLRRVEVAVRVRPLPTRSGGSSSASMCVTLNEAHRSITVADTSGTFAAAAPVQRHEYKLDCLLPVESTNHDLFERLVLKKMRRATADTPDTLCFLAYGHTSSGKTHTIAGSEGEPGLLTLCVEELLRRDGIVEVSMLEIYADKVYDLLSGSAARRVRRRQGPDGPAIIVEDLTTCSLVSPAQWAAVAAHGMRTRRTAATERNARSSRSHAIFTVKSRGVRMCLVDLAGSERQTVFSPQLNKESIAINKSLSRLSTVLEALSVQRVREDGTKTYVNFRDTTLTVLLQRYLSGASMTTFLACVHPAVEFFQETLSTLRYTQRLRRIKTSVVRLGGPGDVSALMPYVGAAEHQELVGELARLRARVEESERNNRMLDQAQRERIAELEAALAQRNALPASPAAEMPEDRARAQRAKEAKRVAGWLLSRVLGDLPTLNVGYDDYFDGFIPRPLQVIGYVSGMSCLPPRTSSAGQDAHLAFLDVGDLSMGLSMVDAGIPPFVRLHRVPCRNPASWEAHDWDVAGHRVFVLCFFEAGDEAVDEATEADGSALSCCGGCVTTEALLPLATVLCVAASTPAPVKEEVLQWLIALQVEQEAAYQRGRDATDTMTSFDGSVSAYLEGSLKHKATGTDDGEDDAPGRSSHSIVRNGSMVANSPTLTSASSMPSVGEALAREVERQSADTSKLGTPFRDAPPSSSADSDRPGPSGDTASAAATGETGRSPPTAQGKQANESCDTSGAAASPSAVHISLKHDGQEGGAGQASPRAAASGTSPPAPKHKGRKRDRKGQAVDEKGGPVKFEGCHGCTVA